MSAATNQRASIAAERSVPLRPDVVGDRHPPGNRDRCRGHPRDLQPRGDDGHEHVRPRPPLARGPAALDRRALGGLLGDRRRRRPGAGAGDGLRGAVGLQGPGGVLDDRRGLGVRRSRVDPRRGRHAAAVAARRDRHARPGSTRSSPASRHPAWRHARCTRSAASSSSASSVRSGASSTAGSTWR